MDVKLLNKYGQIVDLFVLCIDKITKWEQY